MYNIALICDDNYIIPTLVTIRSIKRNRNSDSIYNIYVIVSHGADSIKAKLEKEKAENFCIFIRCFDDNFESINAEHLYVTQAALIKFCLADILDELDEVLYLDGDILVRQGMEKIFEFDITNVYAAVVKDMNIGMSDYAIKIGVSDYFNSGVMYLNLTKIRVDHIRERLFHIKKDEKSHRFMDQDCFNICFNDKIIFLPMIFNLICDLLNNFSIEEIYSYYGELKVSQADKLKEDAIIIHMAGTKKPWKNIDMEFFSEWFSYIEDSYELAFCLKNYEIKWSVMEDRGIRNEKAIGYINSDIHDLQNEILILNEKYMDLQNKKLPLLNKIKSKISNVIRR